MAKCNVCGAEIYFKQNSKRKYVPFNKSDNKCHYENKDCYLMPKKEDKEKSRLVKPDRLWKPRGISYKTTQANTTLDNFTEKKENA